MGEDHPESPFRLPPIRGATPKPRISHFTSSIIFIDASTLTDPNVTILLGTGYSILTPFLQPLSLGPHHSTSSKFTTNKSYIRPRHYNIFSVDLTLPTLTALAFAGPPWFNAVGRSSYAQGTCSHGRLTVERSSGQQSSYTLL
jgi:hypothetical protein